MYIYIYYIADLYLPSSTLDVRLQRWTKSLNSAIANPGDDDDMGPAAAAALPPSPP